MIYACKIFPPNLSPKNTSKVTSVIPIVSWTGSVIAIVPYYLWPWLHLIELEIAKSTNIQNIFLLFKMNVSHWRWQWTEEAHYQIQIQFQFSNELPLLATWTKLLWKGYDDILWDKWNWLHGIEFPIDFWTRNIFIRVGNWVITSPNLLPHDFSFFLST